MQSLAMPPPDYAAGRSSLVPVETLPQEAREGNEQADGHLDRENHGNHLGCASMEHVGSSLDVATQLASKYPRLK